ncbi:MAG: patatin-like phospholipase RssA [Thermodesulfobacteriota bacterium]
MARAQTQTQAAKQRRRPRVGVALGSGSARGWAHIGVLNAMRAAGIAPDVVCGTSIGALVGAAYVTGELPRLERWVRSITRLDILRLLDLRAGRGGFVAGTRVFEQLRSAESDKNIEDLDVRYAAVATDFETGREVWLREGSLLDAVRASISLPGLFVPARVEGRWLVDGGLVNPVPVSVCRALGADVVIAVNLGGDLTSRNVQPALPELDEPAKLEDAISRLPRALQPRLRAAASLLSSSRDRARPPGLLDVVAGSIYIMQDRVTRSRLAGDPADVIVSPRLPHVRLLEFDRAAEVIAEGEASFALVRESVERVLRGAR